MVHRMKLLQPNQAGALLQPEHQSWEERRVEINGKIEIPGTLTLLLGQDFHMLYTSN